MSTAGALVVLALVPAVAWAIAGLTVTARRWWRRRGDEQVRKERLTRILGSRDVVLIPTGDVDLSEETVREIASEQGFHLLGYEWGREPFRRRSGVLYRLDGAVGTVINSARQVEAP